MSVESSSITQYQPLRGTPSPEDNTISRRGRQPGRLPPAFQPLQGGAHAQRPLARARATDSLYSLRHRPTELPHLTL